MRRILSLGVLKLEKAVPGSQKTGPVKANVDMDDLSQPERLSRIPMAARVIWAKSGENDGHSLLLHLLDVAAVAETILTSAEPESTRIWAAKQFGLMPGEVVRWLAVLSGLHDFGKAIPGFQAKWTEGMQADCSEGLGFPLSASGVDRHDLATAALLGPALHGINAAGIDWIRHVVQAVSAHHGYHFLSDEINRGKPRNEPIEWVRARETIFSVMWRFLSPQGYPAVDELSLAAVNWLAGLTSVADWIASNPEWFAFGPRGFDELSDYFEDSCRRARVVLENIDWPVCKPLLSCSSDTDSLVAKIVNKPGVVARPLQRVGDFLLQDVSGPCLLLVEAPMGEGKTELSFLAHLRLQAANHHRGLYVALPTQATGNALFRRALTFLGQFADGPLDVQLVHGGAVLNEDVQRLRDIHLKGISEDVQEGLSASSWFSQRKRPLLSPYGVGTVDQALFSVLNVKHHFVRLWGLANRVVVLDEVHAYDTYTNGLISALLRWLKELGCSVVLMSATLPLARRTELMQAWGVMPDTVPTLLYPRMLLADAGGIRGASFATRNLAPIHLAGVDESIEALADMAVDLLVEGGCGAVIVNTVDRAQSLYRCVRERLGVAVPLLLFHARFPADERALHERQVLEMFGVTGERPPRALLIATQVAEQSLDIDFDFMLSDLAPVDLLLQRAGRLHRHERVRPPRHHEARFWVAGLGEPLPELKETAWAYVYDAYILLRTWALLREELVLQLPADIDRLVQAVYGDEPLPVWLEEAARERIEIESYGEYLARIQKERRESFNIALDPDQEPQVAYNGKPRGSEEGEGVGLENKTRLGRESVTLIPLEKDGSGWCLRPGEAPFSLDQALPDAVARQLHDRQLKVSRPALVKRLKGAEPPIAFQHPLLRNCYPLFLEQGRYAEEGLHLRLDEALGLVYEPIHGLNEELA